MLKSKFRPILQSTIKSGGQHFWYIFIWIGRVGCEKECFAQSTVSETQHLFAVYLNSCCANDKKALFQELVRCLKLEGLAHVIRSNLIYMEI